MILKKPLERDFDLELDTELDPDQTASVSFRQATQRDVERMADLNAETEQTFQGKDVGFSMKRRFSYPEQQREQVYATMTKCNLMIEDDSAKEGVRNLFRFARKPNGLMGIEMTDKEFEAAWGLLQPEVADKIHTRCLEMNPMWDPNV